MPANMIPINLFIRYIENENSASLEHEQVFFCNSVVLNVSKACGLYHNTRFLLSKVTSGLTLDL